MWMFFSVYLLPPCAFELVTSATLTSAVSLWQFLHEQPMPEKALSGWSNLLSLALRKNVVKGSYRHENRKIQFTKSLQSLCVSSVRTAAEGL